LPEYKNMTSSTTLAEIYKHEDRAFLKFLSASKDLQEETIHKLRVKVKHLVSLFKFLEFLSDQKFKQKKHVRFISPVFKRAGKIRSATLNMRLIRAYRSKGILAFKKQLQEDEKRAESDFLEKVHDFDEKKFERLYKLCLKQFKKQKNGSVLRASKRYVDKLMLAIHMDMTELHNDEALHDIRKKLKDIKTIGTLLEDLSPETRAAEVYKKISALEEPIGKWHDTVSLMEEIQKFMATHAEDVRTNEQLSAFVLKLSSGKEAYKKQISKKLYATLK
jgi:CHAD domain-containing protein